MKCVNCDAEADYESPDGYCTFHWIMWWCDGLVSDEDGGVDRTSLDYMELFQESVDSIQKQRS